MGLAEGAFQFFGSGIEAMLNQYVASASARLCTALAGPLAVSVSIWLVLQGWAVARGEVQEPLTDFVRNIIRIGSVGALALSIGAYQDMVAASANALADGLSSVLSGESGGAYGALDLINDGGIQISIGFLRRGEELLPISGYSDILVGLLIIVALGLMLCVLAGFILLAKVALALVLAVGPLFISCLLFSRTAQFFANWLGQMLNYILLMALMSALAGMVTQIYGHYLATVASHDIGTLNAVYELAQIILISGAVLVIAVQIPQVSASLSGGLALSAGTRFISAVLGRILFHTAVDGIGAGPILNTVLKRIDKALAPAKVRYYTSPLYQYKTRLLDRIAGRPTRTPL